MSRRYVYCLGLTLFLLFQGAAAQSSTLAVQSIFSPIVEIIPTIQDTIVFSMKDLGKTKNGDDERKWAFWRHIAEKSLIYRRSSGLLRGKLHELLDNSYDSIVDKIEELQVAPEQYAARILIKAEYRGEDLILTVEDNGKPVTFTKKGKPALRYRDSQRHLGGAGYGIIYLTDGLKDKEKDIVWTALPDGTRTEVKIPIEKISGGFYFKNEEVIISEDPVNLQSVKERKKIAATKLYFNGVKKKADEIGLSKDGLKTLIGEHITAASGALSPDIEAREDNEIAERTEKEIAAVEAQYARVFIDNVRIRSAEARQQKQDVLIGIETTLIPDSQKAYLQGLLAELRRLREAENSGNIIIEYGKAEQLAEFISKEAKEREVPDSNIIFLGREETLDSDVFDLFRDGADPEQWAFFAGVELPEGVVELPGNTYIRLLEMLTKAVNLWAGKTVDLNDPYLVIKQESNHIYKFILPEIIEYDPGVLRQIYSGQLRTIKSA